jgi:hypothetical protein
MNNADFDFWLSLWMQMFAFYADFDSMGVSKLKLFAFFSGLSVKI